MQYNTLQYWGIPFGILDFSNHKSQIVSEGINSFVSVVWKFQFIKPLTSEK